MLLAVICWTYVLTACYGTSPTCDEVVQKVAQTDKMTEIQFPPPMPGTWVSDRCEVRPGPEYLLRWHWYSENGTYTHNTFVYGDEGCTKALWSRCIKGKYGLRGKSWLTQGASQVDFNLDEVMFVVYSTSIAQDLSAKANTSCPGVVVGRWLPEVEYIVYRHQERNDSKEKSKEELDRERACMSLLRLSYEEVGLVRIQKRPPMPYDSWGMREELLLGEAKGKTTVFHDPMVRANQGKNAQSRIYYFPA
ncbi:protein APCDD1-like [Cimex lectularius]|uniref:APCDD1 domain-containing protein n=1 Tax=Cimex lectularius TaxID=79782 RepID=A0A8I6SPQ7_CIMLE|nr:protein APCDD1-like [Cimex lectularius]